MQDRSARKDQMGRMDLKQLMPGRMARSDPRGHWGRSGQKLWMQVQMDRKDHSVPKVRKP
jgi:hypothetical protein